MGEWLWWWVEHRESANRSHAAWPKREPTWWRRDAAYCASKAGVVGLTRCLAIEWAQHGVCVNAIAPGVFPTSLNRSLLEGTPRGKEFLMRIPMRRYGKVEELVGAAIFLSSDAAS